VSTGLRRADGGRASTERLEPRTCKDEEALRKRGPGRPTDTDGLGDGAEMYSLDTCSHESHGAPWRTPSGGDHVLCVQRSEVQQQEAARITREVS
jgi:hypothetical protein